MWVVALEFCASQARASVLLLSWLTMLAMLAMLVFVMHQPTDHPAKHSDGQQASATTI